MGYTESTFSDSMEEQLVAVYAEREHLSRELGVSDAAEIVAMIRNLEAQLKDLYHDREGERLISGGSNKAFRLELTQNGLVTVEFGKIKVEFQSQN